MIQKRFFKNHKLIYMFSLVIGNLYNVLLLPIITTELTSQQYSNYIVVFQIIGFFQAVLSLTYMGGLMKFWNDLDKNKREEYLNSIMFLLLFITFIITIAFHLFTDYTVNSFKYLSGLNKTIILKMNVLLLITIVKFFLLTFYRVSLKPQKHFFYAIIYLTSVTTLLFGYYFFDEITLNILLQIIIISDLLGTIYLTYHYRPYFKFCFKIKYLFSHFKFSWPLILSSLSFVIFQNIDKFIIKSSLTDLTLNRYSTALTLSLVSSLVVKAIASSDFPHLKKLSSEKSFRKEYFIKRKNNSLFLMFIFSTGSIILNDYLFEFLSKTYYTHYSLYCLNLFTIVNFFRLKYLFTENRLFIIDKVKQILVVKLFMLLLCFGFLNLIMSYNVLIVFPFLFIFIYFLIDFSTNIFLNKIQRRLDSFDYRNTFLGFTLVAFATTHFYIQTQGLPLQIIFVFKFSLLVFVIKLSYTYLKVNNHFN